MSIFYDFLKWLSGGNTQVQIVLTVISALLSLAAGLLPVSEIAQRFIRRALGREEPPKTISYSQRLASLMESLTKASSDVDNLLAELAKVARERESAVQKLETDLTKLEASEKQLQKRVQDLQNVPIPVADHFAALVAQEEKRSAWRDYILFGLGVVVSTLIAIGLRLIGLG